MPQDDPELELELLEERAAIIQEGERCSRFMAENLAAKQAGFTDWVRATSKLKHRIRAASDA